MAITAAGVGSGLDINSLVSQLVAAEGQAPSLRLSTKEADLQADLSAYGTLKGVLSQFQTSVQALELDDFQARKSTSSDVDLFTAIADTTAVAGEYNIEVKQLAEAEKLRSGNFTSDAEVVGTGTLDITVGATSFQITVDGTNNTLAGIRDAINSSSGNPGTTTSNPTVTASIINVDDGVGGTVARLILTSDTVGASNTIDVVAVDDDALDGFDLTRLNTANLVEVQPAQDAIIEVDGQAATRDSNSFSDVISGVTFSLKKADVGTVETLTVELNADSIKSNVNSFASSYNAVIDVINNLSSFDADTGASGTLLGDSVLRSVESQLRQAITSSVSGLDFGTLAEIGVTTDENGRLTVDSDDLDAVIDNDFSTVAQLFSSAGGIATTLDTFLDRYVASDGILTARTDGIQSSIDLIGEDRVRLNARLESVEARLQAQFIALDVLVANLQSTGSFLTSQLSNIDPNFLFNK